jgi:hypothetical protein
MASYMGQKLRLENPQYELPNVSFKQFFQKNVALGNYFSLKLLDMEN